MKHGARGFTLLEMALVLVVLGLLLGGLMQPLLTQRAQLQRQLADRQLERARSALVGFVVRHGRLPCPARPGGDGGEQRDAGGCALWRGVVPVRTLGLDGALDARGQWLDPWGRALVYAISDADGDGDAVADWVDADALRRAGLEELRGDIAIGHWAGGACDALQPRAANAVVVVLSHGARDWPGEAEQRNLGGGFASGPYSAHPGCGFDDQLIWVADVSLFSELLRAGQLP